MLTWKDTQEAVVDSIKAPHRSAHVELRLAERDAAVGRSWSEWHRTAPQSVLLTHQRSLISRSDQSASVHEGKTFIVGFALMSDGLTPVMIRRCQRQSSANQQRPSATGDHNTGALILLSGFVVAAAGGAPSRSSIG